jgi:GH25 family lysozyme M1 (1,4-beta-N-acetylmuramidase)
MIKTYPNNSDLQLSEHFNVKEFRCKCGGTHDTLISEELVQMLEKLRAALSCSKISISSGYRCVSHDRAVGGSGTGQHTKGKAADICCYDKNGNPIDNRLVCCTAQDLGFSGIARIKGNGTYTHVDVRTGKWYGDETKGMQYCIPKASFYDYFGIKKGAKTMYKGIDVSEHQGIIKWDNVKTDFAILRAGYGKVISQKDKQFESNYAGAKKAGIPVGAYWYSYAMTPEEARKEADVFLEVIKGKQFEYPVFYDVEEQKQFNLGKDKVSAIIRAFLEEVESAGYWVGLYMSASPLSSYVADTIKQRYCIWVANYGVSQPSYAGTYGLWQYSCTGRVNGINGNVDLDYSYVDYPTQIKTKGLNGFGSVKVPETPAKKEITVEMTVDGTKYKGTMKEV